MFRVRLSVDSRIVQHQVVHTATQYRFVREGGRVAPVPLYDMIVVLGVTVYCILYIGVYCILCIVYCLANFPVACDVPLLPPILLTVDFGKEHHFSEHRVCIAADTD